MNPENLRLILGILAALAAIIGGLYGVVTVPILRTIKAEVGASEARVKEELKTEIRMAEERIIDRLNNHSERITRLEERRFQ